AKLLGCRRDFKRLLRMVGASKCQRIGTKILAKHGWSRLPPPTDRILVGNFSRPPLKQKEAKTRDVDVAQVMNIAHSLSFGLCHVKQLSRLLNVPQADQSKCA